ncbi:MAG TPA: amidase [Steroidobacteraceae bacterium]|jgi:Asp-tRNA(Asn)/Glu-tRNA(Gln) amidotransferase A subunit family amidase
MIPRGCIALVVALVVAALACASQPPAAVPLAGATFHLQEATIADIQNGIRSHRITAVQLVRLYLARIKAYNGTCVREPQGPLGPVTTIAHAGQLNSLSTLNLRPATRRELGFDEHKARSMTDATDADPAMPDALETAAELDNAFARTGKLVGSLHGVVMAIKDQYDTFDMRTTSGADAGYANDRPPRDATFVKRLREAGAIIIAKANMGEYASGDRSSFGGTFCNPYDTQRSPGRSSGGSGAAVAANLVTCAIGEESGPSIRNPAKNNDIVGLAPTQELVSRAGMMRASFMNDRVGPMCRTVADAARVLDVIAGYDPKDELTAFSLGRLPKEPYASHARKGELKGVRVGVLREFMNKDLFTLADAESIEIVERVAGDLRKLGATVVDPGPGGALFQECLAKYQPATQGALFIHRFPKLFPVDDHGRPTGDHIPLLVDMAGNASLFPPGVTIRDLGTEKTTGEGRYVLDVYLRERGDAKIRTTEDLVQMSKFYNDIREDSGFNDKRQGLQKKFDDKTLDLGDRLQTRFVMQQVGLQCLALKHLDAVMYPTGNIPPPKLGAPTEPTVNGRSAMAWTAFGAHGFPAISVPAGFTTQVYDRERKPSGGGTQLVGPVPAKLPVGVDFLGAPFAEPTLLRIAAAYEAATQHRSAPSDFGPVPGEP